MGETDPPKISVIIPTYNRAHLVGRAIQSVFDQTYRNFELIVVDDASNDKTKEVISSIDDSRIRYLRHDINRGGGAARNTGIRESRGDYIAFLDSDDEWLPTKLDRSISCLQNSTDKVGLIYSRHILHDDETSRRMLPKFHPYSGDVYKRLLSGWCPATTSTVLVDKHHLINAGMFDPDLSSFQDYDLWLRISQICYFEVVDDILLIQHIHSGKRVSKNPKNRLNALNRIIDKWGETIDRELGKNSSKEFYDRQITSIYANFVLTSIENDNRFEGIKYFIEYIKKYKYLSFIEALSLISAIIGGIPLYTIIKSLWRKFMWDSPPL